MFVSTSAPCLPHDRPQQRPTSQETLCCCCCCCNFRDIRDLASTAPHRSIGHSHACQNRNCIQLSSIWSPTAEKIAELTPSISTGDEIRCWHAPCGTPGIRNSPNMFLTPAATSQRAAVRCLRACKCHSCFITSSHHLRRQSPMPVHIIQSKQVKCSYSAPTCHMPRQ
jgi:hypothetical protein